MQFCSENNSNHLACIRLLLPLALFFFAPVCLCAQTNEPAATSEQKNILILGDSLAAGYGLEPEEAFPVVLEKTIRKHGLNFNVINAGSSGDTSAGGLRRIDWLLKRKIDVLVLELGGNDGLRGIQPDATKTNLQGIIDRTKKKLPGVRIVIAGMKMPPNMGAQYGAKFEKIFPELAQENNALLVPFLLEGVGGNPALNLPDRIHPTAEGQKILAENVWEIIRPLLEELQGSRSKEVRD